MGFQCSEMVVVVGFVVTERVRVRVRVRMHERETVEFHQCKYERGTMGMKYEY